MVITPKGMHHSFCLFSVVFAVFACICCFRHLDLPGKSTLLVWTNCMHPDAKRVIKSQLHIVILYPCPTHTTCYSSGSTGNLVTIWAALREKVPNVLSHCHTKRRTGARGRARPSFGMTPTYQKKKKKSKNFSPQNI